ncbi:MAG: response regulator transcription factor [bacterium]
MATAARTAESSRAAKAPQAIRVFLADSQDLLREGVKRILAQRGGFDVVGEAGDGQTALAQVLKTKPDVVLIDVMMPVLNGVDAAREILRELPETKVVALSIYASEEYIHQILDAGAIGYVLKDTKSEDLVRALELVSEGIPFFSPAISKAVVAGYLKRRGDSKKPSPYDQLTPRERQVLQLIAEGRRNREISSLLHLSIKTVEVHRAHIMDKLKARSIADLVLIAIGKGIVKL